MHSFKFSAVHLLGAMGELVNANSWRAEARLGEKGNLTYGPYIRLEPGHYSFAVEYSGKVPGAGDVGSWDVFTNAQGGVILGQGSLPSTQGNLERILGHFEVPQTLSRGMFEIRTFFHGVGLLDIYAINIDCEGDCKQVSFGDLARLDPISDTFGFDRGQPIDRFYIAEFLAKHQADIRGRTLEVGNRRYTDRFGGRRVSKSDVLSPPPGKPGATIIADLQGAPEIPDNTFDCIILTQVLVCIYDLAGTVSTIHRILKPGGVALVTLPSITKVHQDYEWPFYWGFTDASAKRLFENSFGPGNVEVALYGNILAATGFLYGLSFHELNEGELRYCDPNFQVIIGLRAVKTPS